MLEKNNVENVIKKIYQEELNGNPDDLINLHKRDDNYYIRKRNGKEVQIVREWVEDFVEDDDSLSKSKIRNMLNML